MDWKDIAQAVGKAAPILGTLLGGPAGTAVGALVASALGTDATPAAVDAALTSNPDALVKLRQVEADRAGRLQELLVQAEQNRLQAELASVQSVNLTMQAEAKADHWPTYSWRPAIGFAVAIDLVLATLLVIGVFIAVCRGAQGADKAVAALPMVLGTLTALVGLATPILGIASWFRGKMQADPNVPSDNRG